MFIVIGKIESADDKLEACRVLNTDTMEVKDISVGRIRNAMGKGDNVVGFKLLYYSTGDYKSDECRFSLQKLKSNQFSWSKVPALDGYGSLVNPEDKKLLTLYAWKGFGSAKRYHLVNYEGKEIIMDRDALFKRVEANEVNGLSIKNGRLSILDELNNELI